MATPGASRDRITREDLEDKFRELEGDAREQVESARSTAITAGVVAAIVLLLIAFLLGRRKGAKRSTVVEIRRV
jgi:tetrahydromethanopterin S-methyltransferase subunit F